MLPAILAALGGIAGSAAGAGAAGGATAATGAAATGAGAGIGGSAAAGGSAIASGANVLDGLAGNSVLQGVQAPSGGEPSSQFIPAITPPNLQPMQKPQLMQWK